MNQKFEPDINKLPPKLKEKDIRFIANLANNGRAKEAYELVTLVQLELMETFTRPSIYFALTCILVYVQSGEFDEAKLEMDRLEEYRLEELLDYKNRQRKPREPEYTSENALRDEKFLWLVAQKKPEELIEFLNSLSEIPLYFIANIVDLGIQMWEEDQSKYAEMLFKIVLDLDPICFEANSNTILILLEKGKLAEAELFILITANQLEDFKEKLSYLIGISEFLCDISEYQLVINVLNLKNAQIKKLKNIYPDLYFDFLTTMFEACFHARLETKCLSFAKKLFNKYENLDPRFLGMMAEVVHRSVRHPELLALETKEEYRELIGALLEMAKNKFYQGLTEGCEEPEEAEPYLIFLMNAALTYQDNGSILWQEAPWNTY